MEEEGEEEGRAREGKGEVSGYKLLSYCTAFHYHITSHSIPAVKYTVLQILSDTRVI